MNSFRTVLHDPEACPLARVLLPNAFLWLVPSSQDFHVTRNLLRKSSPKCTFRSHCIQKELHLVSKKFSRYLSWLDLWSRKRNTDYELCRWPRTAAAAGLLWQGKVKVGEKTTRALAEMRERLVLRGIRAGMVQMEYGLRNKGSCVR